MKQSQRAAAVGLSSTLALDEKVRLRIAAGEKIWNFGAGQPDFPTPEHAAEAGIRAIREGKTRYTSPAGTLELRCAIAQKLRQENGLEYEPSEILVAAGAKQALYMVLAALVDPGDEVLIPSPYWVSYPAQIDLLGAVPRIISTDERTGFKLSADTLREAITPRTRCLILNTPANPSGAVYRREELAALAEVVLENGLHLVTDEIYERIVYDGTEHVSPASISADLRARTVVVNGVSKAFAMTGWRIGYAAGPPQWIGAALAVQSHLTGNACSISQEAAAAALSGAEPEVERMIQSFARRRRRVIDILGQATELRLCPPDGTFYALPDFSAFFGRERNGRRVGNAEDLAEFLLEEAGVALVPGGAFGSERHLRISFAVSDSTIEEGLESLVQALRSLNPS